MPNPRANIQATLRIIAGSLRGSRLAVSDRPGLRPTPDRVRETLFNWLSPWLEGARCLDLFAGTGALGIEAWSRGAAECVLVERDRGLCAVAAGQSRRASRSAVPACVNDEAAAFLAAPAPAPGFDLVFLDPPFEAGLWTAAAQALEQGGWLRQGAWSTSRRPRGAIRAAAELAGCIARATPARCATRCIVAPRPIR